EPTNHLDISARDALEKVLSAYDGTILLVSHDRYFLDKIAQRILHLENGQIQEYRGNYSSYRQKRARQDTLSRKKKARKKAASHDVFKDGGFSRKKLASLEAEVAYLEDELADVDKLLQNSELSTDWQALKSLHEQRQDLADRLEALLAKWMEMSEAFVEKSEDDL
ncbi:ABC-F family ATP-binding cassette domain-containing protein, partial [bacterium]|nr:ABC-F family ATP-binding cassette domain-containing protein [bacterium]